MKNQKGTSTVPALAAKTQTGIQCEVNGDRLFLSLPYDKNGTGSKSGNSIIHATTSGNKQVVVDGRVMNIGVNVYCKVG